MARQLKLPNLFVKQTKGTVDNADDVSMGITAHLENQSALKDIATERGPEPASTEAATPVAVKRKTVRKVTNLKQWQLEFPWLEYDEDNALMTCRICKDAQSVKRSNAFVKGSGNFQRSALLRHAESDDHRIAKKVLSQRTYMSAAQKIVADKFEPVLMAQLRTAAYMAKQNIADRKFGSLIDLQLSNGATVFREKKGVYTSCSAASEMHKCLADVCREEIRVRLAGTPFLGLMLDESLDISVSKKLVLFCKILHSGTVKVMFCANVEVKDGKAETICKAVYEFLDGVGVSVSKISGIGTDGASVMTGSKSGVGVRLKMENPKIIHVWCAAHRLALVAHWASKTIPFLQKVQETVLGIYNFYCYSAVRYNKIKELTKIMNLEVKRFKKPTQVRWLSVHEAIDAIHGALSVLYLSLDQEAGSGEGSGKAKGLKQTIQTFKFLATVCLLKEILADITRLSKVFQLDLLGIDQLETMLTATRQHIQSLRETNPPAVEELLVTLETDSVYKGIPVTRMQPSDREQFNRLKIKFVDNIEAEFEKRFDESDIEVLKDLNILLNPVLLPKDVQGIHDHGQESLSRVCRFYEDTLSHEQMKESFAQYKYFMANHRDMPMGDFCLKLANECSDIFPGFSKAAEIILTIPLTSVPCERGFSVQNKIIGPLRNKLSVQNVENKTLIQTCDLDSEILCQRACSIFLKSARSKCKK